MRRIAFCLVVLGVVAGPPAAVADTMKLTRVTAGATTIVGDGKRHLALSSGGAISLLDVTTGKRSTLPTAAPPTTSQPCALAGLAADQTLLLNCPANDGFDSGLTYNFATGAFKQLTIQRGPCCGDDSVHFVGLGTRWAQVRFAGYHYFDDGYVNRSTGELVRPSQDRSPVNRIPDLESPVLYRNLCSGMRRASVPNDGSGLGLSPGPLAISGKWAAATTYTDAPDPPGRVVLQRCGHPQRVLDHCKAVGCSQPVINSRIVAWLQRDPKTTGVTLRVYSLKTRRTKRLRISSTNDPDPAIMLLSHRLLVVSDERVARVVGAGA